MNKRKLDEDNVSKDNIVQSRFKSESGELLSEDMIELPIDVNVGTLQELCNALLQQEKTFPLAFYVNNVEVTDTLEKHVDKNSNDPNEYIVEIVYQPQAVFKIRAVTRCTGSLEGYS